MILQNARCNDKIQRQEAFLRCKTSRLVQELAEGPIKGEREGGGVQVVIRAARA